MTENRCYGRLIILFAIGLFCAGATTAATATVRIASWNTLHSGWQNEKHFEAVAAVMAQFDLIAVQELMEPTALARMDNALEDWTGQQWQHLASEAEGRTSYKEHYGFLWRTDRIVFTGQAVSYIDDRAAFARDPFAAVFRSKGNGRRIALATVHIRFGDSQADRRPEIRALAHYWRWLAQIYPDADLRVLAGDMNMAPDDPAWRQLDRNARLLLQHGATTLSTTPGQFASLYDQIIVPESFDRQNPAATWGIFNYIEHWGWPWSVREHVSDHLPVYLVIGEKRFRLRDFGHDPATLIAGGDTRPRCIQLNSAPAARLDALPHIGPSRADAIVAGRPWTSADALVAVDGLGNARVSDIKDSGLLCAQQGTP